MRLDLARVLGAAVGAALAAVKLHHPGLQLCGPGDRRFVPKPGLGALRARTGGVEVQLDGGVRIPGAHDAIGARNIVTVPVEHPAADAAAVRERLDLQRELRIPVILLGLQRRRERRTEREGADALARMPHHHGQATGRGTGPLQPQILERLVEAPLSRVQRIEQLFCALAQIPLGVLARLDCLLRLFGCSFEGRPLPHAVRRPLLVSTNFLDELEDPCAVFGHARNPGSNGVLRRISLVYPACEPGSGTKLSIRT